jgi:Helix-turn-helix domain
MITDTFYTVEEVADFLRISHQSVHNLLRRELVPRWTCERQLYIRKADLVAVLRAYPTLAARLKSPPVPPQASRAPSPPATSG